MRVFGVACGRPSFQGGRWLVGLGRAGDCIVGSATICKGQRIFTKKLNFLLNAILAPSPARPLRGRPVVRAQKLGSTAQPQPLGNPYVRVDTVGP
jgi:hypothetical protein